MKTRFCTLALFLAVAAAPQLASAKGCLKGAAVGGELMEGFEVQVELLRARLQRKPVASVTSFRSHAAWAG